MQPETERKTVKVTIFNQTYTLASTGQPGEIEALAATVDDLMTDVASRAGNMDSQRIAVLACLHMADRLRAMETELAEIKDRVERKTKEFSLLLDKTV